jgi:cobalamin biosynthesis protein CobD/CbiB
MLDKDSETQKENSKNITIRRMFAIGTILALLISVPAIIVTLFMHYIFKMHIVVTAIASMIILFIDMGFAFKFSKRFARFQA